MIDVRRPVRPFLRRLVTSANYLIPFGLIGITISGHYLGKLILALIIVDILHKWFTLEAPLKSPEKWSFVICGAGLSGLAAAHKLKEAGIKDVVILEKAANLGGTWLFNTYPGIDCDLSIHFYSYSFHLNPWWTSAFASGEEIRKYLENFATKYNLKGIIRFDHKITDLTWDDDGKAWTIFTEHGMKFKANFFISCTGALHIPNKPVFKGHEAFKGDIFHTAEWDWSVDLRNRIVSVIGTGASAVQVVPSIAEKVKELNVFQRHASWILPKNNSRFYSVVKCAFAACPWLMRVYRFGTFLWWELVFHVLYALPLDTSTRSYFSNRILRFMKESLGGDEELLKELTPNYELGCKRLVPATGYLQSLRRDNVHLITARIDRFTQSGIMTTDGNVHESNAIILATGYDLLRTVQAWNAYGRDGQVLWRKWDDTPRAHYGMTYPGFPNIFMILGPSSIPNIGTFPFMAECQIAHMMDCIRKMEADGCRSVEVKKEALDDYVAWVERTMKNRPFGKGCTSWFANERGIKWVLWPSSMTSFWWNTLSCKKSDFIFSK